jgi:hypothetical protein
MAAIFLKLHDCLLAHGWTQASGTSGSFFTTYDPAAGTPSTSDLRRVYAAPLANSNSGLSSKYVMLRLQTSAAGGTAYIANAVNIQMIPHVSWNTGTDIGTNPAGTTLATASGANGTYDASNWNQASSYQMGKAPHTWFATGVNGFIYVAASAKWICIWPYFNSTTIFDGQRNGFLICGEISDDFASYANVPPVYVTTLQRLMGNWGCANDPLNYVNGGYSPQTYHAMGPQFYMPVTPASTTGYTGVSDTTRNGYQAMGSTRFMLGHYGYFGYEGFDWLANNSSYNYAGYNQTQQAQANQQSKPMPLVQNIAAYSSGTMNMGKFALKRYEDAISGSTTRFGEPLTQAQSFAPTALNSTNFKGLEPILGGGCMSSNYAGYDANPYPMFWVLGRVFGLKWVGQPITGSWTTLDTVNMSTDASYFYTKTGGTTNSFILLGAGPGSADLAAGAPNQSPKLFWALPA